MIRIILKSMEFIDQECSSGEESERTSEYDSSICSNNDDIEFMSGSSDENYFASNTQKSKAFVSDDDDDDDTLTDKMQGLKKERSVPHMPKTKNKKNCETTENSHHTINVPCKDLAKGPPAETWTYNITLPKNTGNFVIHLKRRKFKTITLNCTFGESVTLLHQTSNAVITSNTQSEKSKLLFLFFVFFRHITKDNFPLFWNIKIGDTKNKKECPFFKKWNFVFIPPSPFFCPEN